MKKEQLWQTLLLILPVVLAGTLAKEFASSSTDEFAYSGLGGLFGAVCGGVLYYGLKDKSNLVKGLALAGFVGGLFLAFFLIVDIEEDVWEQEWVEQKIGLIEFETPYKLKPGAKITELPAGVNDMDMYTMDELPQRLIELLHIEFSTDSVSLEGGLMGSIQSMMSVASWTPDQLHWYPDVYDPAEMYGPFSIKWEADSVRGYAYATKLDSVATFMILMPAPEGFSEEFIERIDLGIIPDF